MNISPLSPNSSVSNQTPVSAPAPQVQLGLSLPADLFIPDENGTKPIEAYDIKLVPKNAVIMSEQETQELVDKAKKIACPDGMVARVADSKAAKNIETAKKVIQATANGTGQIALWNLAASSGVAIASGVSIAAGAAGVLVSLESLKESFNLKGYYEGLKEQGFTDIEVPLKQPDGSDTKVEVPIDKLISGAKKSVVVNSLKTVGSALMATAGFAGGAAGIVAVAAIALNLGTTIYSNREAIAQIAQKTVEGIKNTAVNVANKIIGHQTKKSDDVKT